MELDGLLETLNNRQARLAAAPSGSSHACGHAYYRLAIPATTKSARPMRNS